MQLHFVRIKVMKSTCLECVQVGQRAQHRRPAAAEKAGFRSRRKAHQSAQCRDLHALGRAAGDRRLRHARRHR